MRTSIRTSTLSNATCISQGCRRVFASDLRDAWAKRLRALFAPVAKHVGKHVPHVVPTAAAAAGMQPAARPPRSRQPWQVLPVAVYAG